MNKQPSLVKIFAGSIILIALVLLVYDSKFHFDADIVERKEQSYSAQRNWNLNYVQDNVYRGSSFRYQRDFNNIYMLIEPNSVLLSDLATSYFAAAILPVYVVNIHRHQGRNLRQETVTFLNNRFLCYLEFEENRQKVSKFLRKNNEIDYFLINKDRVNENRERDCLAFRSDTLIEQLSKFSDLLWEGEFLNLYSVRYTQQ